MLSGINKQPVTLLAEQSFYQVGLLRSRASRWASTAFPVFFWRILQAVSRVLVQTAAKIFHVSCCRSVSETRSEQTISPPSWYACFSHKPIPQTRHTATLGL